MLFAKTTFAALAAFAAPLALVAQISVTPANPTLEDTVTVIYDASLGNAALLGLGQVYAHTGVLTTESLGPWDWKYVKTDWGQNTPAVSLDALGNNLHRLRFHVRSYYGIPDSVVVTDLAFVFRNADATLVGRTAQDGDIFYPIVPEGALENYQSHSMADGRLLLRSESRTYTVQAHGPHILRVAFSPDTLPLPDSSAIVVLPPSASASLSESADALVYATSHTALHIQKSPLRMSIVYEGDTLLQDKAGFYTLGNSTRLSLQAPPGEAYHGTGFRAVGLNLRGRQLGMLNQAQYGYGPGADLLNICIPFVVASAPYGLYFEHTLPAVLTLGQVGNSLAYATGDAGLAYYFIGAADMPALLDRYTDLTGKAPLPPRWALGYIQSRYGYETEAEARNIVAQMQAEGFPLDALVLDLYWFGDPSTMGNLDWDAARFPTPVDMMADFRAEGIKTVLITEPYVTTASSNYGAVVGGGHVATTAAGTPYVINNFWAGPSALLDLSDTAAQAWMWDFYQNRILEGVAGWWCDLGEPESHPADMWHHGRSAAEVHNRFSWDWAKMLHGRYAAHHPEQRLFNLIRSGYAGMQRFGAIPWSGDIQRSFGGLAVQVPIMLNMGYSGVGYMHSDLGGFAGGGQDNELYARWLELGTFSPIMRAHGVGVPPEPIFYPDPFKSVVREAIAWRYRLLPYNYTLAWENSTKGWPLARAMNFYEPGNPALQDLGDQYFWGEHLLVAPVLQPGLAQRALWLPAGNWVHYHSGQIYAGGTSVTVAAPLGQMPVFVKGGSFIPHAPLHMSTDDYQADALSFWYYPDADAPQSAYTLYNDDGSDPQALANAAHEFITVEGFYDPASTLITLAHEGSFAGMPAQRDIEFRVKNIVQVPDAVRLQNEDLPMLGDMASYASTWPSAYYDAEAGELYVHWDWDHSAAQLEILSLVASTLPQAQRPAHFQLFPNTVAHSAQVLADIAQAGNYRLDVLDAQGRSVALLWSQHLPAGRFEWTWTLDGRLPAGLYYLRLSGPQGVQVLPLRIWM